MIEKEQKYYCDHCGNLLDGNKYAVRIDLFPPEDQSKCEFKYCLSCFNKFERDEEGNILDYKINNPIDNRFDILDL